MGKGGGLSSSKTTKARALLKRPKHFDSEFLEDGYLAATYPIRVPCADYSADVLLTEHRIDDGHA